MKKIFTFIGLVSIPVFSSAQIVISEIYGGGGDAGSSFRNDYVILKNIGPENAVLKGATLQYVSFADNSTQYHLLPEINLMPGQTFLIQEGSGGGGVSDLPAPDFIAGNIMNSEGYRTSDSGINIDRISGRVILASDATRVLSAGDANVLDFVNYGSTIQFAGTGTTVSPNSTTAFKRMENSMTNTFDFVIAPASPVNAAIPAASAVINETDVNYSKFNFILNPFIKGDTDLVFGGEVQNVRIFDEFGQVVMQSPKKTASGLNIIELPKGKYTVTGMINNAPVSQQIVKD